MFMLACLGGYIFALLLLFLLRRAVGLFWTTSGFFFATFAYIRFGIEPPLPSSVLVLYVTVTVIALALYVTSSRASWAAFSGPLIAVMVQPRLRLVRGLLLVTIPALIAWQSYEASIPSEAPPPRTRSVHPSPPASITSNGPNDKEAVELDVVNGTNPLRAHEESDPERFAADLTKGKAIYYQNCYYCHGDHLMADGHYADAVKPPPANFQDPGTIAMLQETYIFWRVAKGGPGLPDAGTPWDSSMPAWEKMLDNEEMWQVIMYLYDHTGYAPRTAESHGEGGGH